MPFPTFRPDTPKLGCNHMLIFQKIFHLLFLQFSGGRHFSWFFDARGLSHPLHQLLSNGQFAGIRATTGQSGINELFAKQLVCGEFEKCLKFGRRQAQSNECQSLSLLD